MFFLYYRKLCHSINYFNENVEHSQNRVRWHSIFVWLKLPVIMNENMEMLYNSISVKVK